MATPTPDCVEYLQLSEQLSHTKREREINGERGEGRGEGREGEEGERREGERI